ncbi:uncharacterized protein L3040_005153 [Drepanopeziza brunnea f. sp. 'multigermtubi']|uniref:uncharacterized protein n=1 Tax=Drepanopeziza brunnea f. sp. 'multigermtubi' TaxID=698441 RepID=UPI00239DABB5|nr:hypothetical protein L3040_005153 [Drepanopeziza brunnea f. sp. 'multigermtubi']
MQSIDPRGRQEASGTSARATDPFSRPAEPPSMLPNDPGTRNTFERPDGDAPDLDNYASDLGFDLDSLPYSKPESHTKARLIIEDFLDIKSEGLRDHELWSLFRHAFARWSADEFSLATKQAHGHRGSKFTLLIRLRDHLMSKGVWCLPRQKGYANGLASIIQMEKEHQWTWEEQREQSIEGFDSRWNDITIARLNRQTEEVAKIQGKQVERFPDQSGLIRLTKIIDEPLLSNSPPPTTSNSLRQSLREEENEELQRQILRNEELQRRNNAIARDLDDLRNLTITRDAQQRKERIEEATRHKEELKAARQSKTRFRADFTFTRDIVEIFFLVYSNPRKERNTFGQTGKLPRSLKRLRIDKRDTWGMRIAKDKPKGTDITKLEPQPVTRMALATLTMTDEEETGEIGREIEATGTEEVRTAPLDHQGDSKTDLQGTLDSEMSRQGTLDKTLDEDTNPPANLGQTEPFLAPLFRLECWPGILTAPQEHPTIATMISQS